MTQVEIYKLQDVIEAIKTLSFVMGISLITIAILTMLLCFELRRISDRME